MTNLLDFLVILLYSFFTHGQFLYYLLSPRIILRAVDLSWKKLICIGISWSRRVSVQIHFWQNTLLWLLLILTGLREIFNQIPILNEIKWIMLSWTGPEGLRIVYIFHEINLIHWFIVIENDDGTTITRHMFTTFCVSFRQWYPIEWFVI